MTKSEVKALDALVTIKVHERPDCCEFCKLVGPYHAHHLISRSYRSVRWEPDNLVKICNRCHYKAHQHPLWAERMAEEHLGAERWQELKHMAERVKGVNDYELVKLLWR